MDSIETKIHDNQDKLFTSKTETILSLQPPDILFLTLPEKLNQSPFEDKFIYFLKSDSFQKIVQWGLFSKNRLQSNNKSINILINLYNNLQKEENNNYDIEKFMKNLAEKSPNNMEYYSEDESKKIINQELHNILNDQDAKTIVQQIQKNIKEISNNPQDYQEKLTIQLEQISTKNQNLYFYNPLEPKAQEFIDLFNQKITGLYGTIQLLQEFGLENHDIINDDLFKQSLQNTSIMLLAFSHLAHLKKEKKSAINLN